MKANISSESKSIYFCANVVYYMFMKISTLFSLLLLTTGLQAQNLNGQWRGSFIDGSTAFAGFGGQKIVYVLELEIHDNTINGYSYTYFSEGEKKYYTICKVKGMLNKAAKELEVKEYERTKFNTPPEFHNCFQVHKLKYSKDTPEEESLQGTWIPAPDQKGDCGYGKTLLIRKRIKPYLPPVITKNNVPSTPKKDSPIPNSNKEHKQSSPIVTRVPARELIKKNSVPEQNQTAKKQLPVNNTLPKVTTKLKDTVPAKGSLVNDVAIVKKDPEIVSQGNYEKRNNTVVETINIKNDKFTVDFYDDGAIDGDSISVFFNGRLMLSHQRLTEKPITLTLSPDSDHKINELVMYAENMGEIPPNTALMIIHDGDTRYEVRIVSDTEKNGTIRFTHLPR